MDLIEKEQTKIHISAKQKSLRWLIFGITCLFFLLEMTFHRSALVEQIIPAWRFTGILVGIILGCWIVYWYTLQPKAKLSDWRIYLGFFMLPFIGAATGSYAARSMYEFKAFYGYDTAPIQLNLMVKSISSRNSLTANVTAFKILDGVKVEGREVKVEIDGTLYANLEPYRQPGRDCLSLPAQIGRNGIRRLVLSATWFDEPIGIGHLSRCAT